jgi:arylsulfatase A-like enzyme
MVVFSPNPDAMSDSCSVTPTCRPTARRSALISAVVALAAAVSCAASISGGAAAAPPRPNIVFFLADDLGYGDLGCQGHPRILTPQLDRLAGEGTRFTQFYVSPSCSPTRASIITGQHPSRWRIYAPVSSLAANEARKMPHWLDVTAPSLPRALQQAGYRTAHFGKWHLGGGSGSWRDGRLHINHPAAPPVSAYGFEVVRSDFGNGPTWRAARPVEESHELYHYDEPEWQTWSSRAISDAAIGFIEEHRRRFADRPFLLHVFYKDPHVPMRPTAEMAAPYADVPEPARTHFAMVSEMDAQIGRVLAKLDELGLRENTLVLFASDNGAAINRGGSNGPLRGWKWYLNEGGIRVPLIIRWPGRVPAGRVDSASLLHVCDLMPTFLRMAAGVMPETDLGDGQDATEALLGRDFQRIRPMMWHHPMRYRSLQALAIRDGRWKLLMDPDGSNLELYDLAQDEGERHNLADAHPQQVAGLRDRLESWYDSLPRPLPPLNTQPVPPERNESWRNNP